MWRHPAGWTAVVGLAVACAAGALATPVPKPFAHSCWAADFGSTPARVRPSAFPKPSSPRIAPEEVARRALERFGDTRFIHRIELGPVPPAMSYNSAFRRGAPPPDALWAYVAAKKETVVDPRPSTSAGAMGISMLAQWEWRIFVGGLYDDFCAAGGRPLVGATVAGRPGGVIMNGDARLRRYPNPSETAFRTRIEEAERRLGFRLVSLELLHPRQAAPVVVVEMGRDRSELEGADVRAIYRELATVRPDRRSPLFEGFFLEARDANGPFVFLAQSSRGSAVTAEWSSDPALRPYGPISRPPVVTPKS